MDVRDAVVATILSGGLPARRSGNTVQIYPDLRVEIDAYPGGAMLTIIGDGPEGPMVTYGTFRARAGSREVRENVLNPLWRVIQKLPTRDAASGADRAAAG